MRTAYFQFTFFPKDKKYIKAWPNARNILQHCCMILRHVLNGVAKCTQHFHHFQRNMSMSMCPRPLARKKWTERACLSATMLRERGQTSKTSCCTKNLTVFKFDATYIEDITRWREDMNFMFEWQEQYLTSEPSERVRYCGD